MNNNLLIKKQLQILLEKIVIEKKFNKKDYEILLQLLYHELVIDTEFSSKENQILINAILYYCNEILRIENCEKCDTKRIEDEAFFIKELKTEDIMNKILSPRNKTERSRNVKKRR